MVGPDYRPPTPDIPPVFGEVSDAVAVATADAERSAEVAWWHRFDDAGLASLVERAVAANHSVKVAEARVRQGRSVGEVAASLLYRRLRRGGAHAASNFASAAHLRAMT